VGYGKLEMAAWILVAVILAGTGIGVAVHQAWAGAGEANPARVDPQRPNPQPVAQGEKGDIDRLRREIGTLRTELEEARKEIKDLRDALRLGNARPEKEPLYRGKPVSFWLEQGKDGDAAYRKEAVIAIGMLALQNKKL